MAATVATKDARAVRRIMHVTATIVFGVGTVVLVVGWWGGVDIVTRVLPSLVSMKANTAVGFILAGVALAPVVRQRAPRLATAAAWLLAALGAATWFEYVADVSLGIDELLAQDTNPIGTAHLGRMGLNTAIGFTLLGPAIVAGEPRRSRGTRVAAQATATVTGLLALLALLGYGLGASSAVGIGSATEMALHTSAMFIVAVLGLLAGTADVGLLASLQGETATSRAGRRLVPAIVGALLLVTALVDLLATTPWLDDVRLQLALTATGGVAVAAGATLLVLRRTATLEAEATAAQRELEAVRVAFGDVFLRVGAGDVVLSVHGDAATHGLTLPGAGVPLAAAGPGAPSLVGALARARERGAAEATYDSDGAGAYEARLVALDGDDVAVAIRDVSRLASVERELRVLAADLERQVAERTAELEATNRELERFAYLASHDLQEPLRMVSGFVSRIGDRYGDVLDDRGREYVRFAVDGAERMSALIDGLLAYSRAGRVDEDRLAPTSASRLVTQVVAAMAGAVDDVGGTVHLDLAADATVVVDPTLARQVVQNLLSNALKFRRPGAAPTVTISVAHVDDDVVVRVEDDGIGVAAEHRGEVFAMFRRVSTDPEHRGTGIGLSLVQQIVEAHKGSVRLEEATSGQGTAVVVHLPAVPLAATVDAAPAASGAAAPRHEESV